MFKPPSLGPPLVFLKSESVGLAADGLLGAAARALLHRIESGRKRRRAGQATGFWILDPYVDEYERT